MNMNSENRALNDAELEVVAGGSGGMIDKVLAFIQDVTSNKQIVSEKSAAQWDAILRG
jgi:hypothetical protein